MVLNFTCFEMIFQVRIPDLLQGNQFAKVLGDHAKTGRATVLRVGLFVEGEGGFQMNRIESLKQI